VRANVADEALLLVKSATDLTTFLGDILADDAVTVGAAASTASKPDGQDKPAKPQGGKAAGSADIGAGAKGQHPKPGAGGGTTDKSGYPGACWYAKRGRPQGRRLPE
jgi:hypothetical protein